MYKEIAYDRRRFLATTAKTIAAAQLGLLGCGMKQFTSTTVQLPVKGEFPLLVGATELKNKK